ncbi:hypothetical protein, variant [Puccinia striiformis f. sp. tritici PST-78]|uniref:Uncharacterized protein n=1 Tax=Puccinia striiformis f. sp. tritici PST-78 TaxID=1165861 RepID=A0A0L0W2L6_9BASI|nr:hypothetical protein PSTG_01149 [Puccinia striiformis f. sp. tritici PST-78]KNF05751.1 hypothetical protein, variant [Puccinia striiformis f. sp. tritici PST-78]
MENVDDGAIYIDVMSWLLSPSSQDGHQEDDQDERMLDNLCQLIVHLRLSLVDQLMMATIHSQKLWSISTPRIANTDGLVGSREIPLKNKATEPFLSIFLKLKSACLDKFHRSSSSPHSTYPKNSDQNDVHQNRSKLNSSAINFIERWRSVAVRATRENPGDAPFASFDLRRLCLMAALLASMKSFDLSSTSSRLQSLIEQDCIRFIKQSIRQTQSISLSTPITFDQDSVITWLAVQIIPSIHPINLGQSSTNIINDHLVKSLTRVFENGHLFDNLSTSLVLAPHSLNIRPLSSTDKDLKRVSSDPLAQVVLSISLSISQLIENTTRITDLKSFSTDLAALSQMTEKINNSWLMATHSYNQVNLPEFQENTGSISNLKKSEENEIDRWLRNGFFCCLLIIGGLVNKLAIQGGLSHLMAESLLPSAFQILCQIHFITLRFPSDKLSTFTAVFDALIALAKPHGELPSRILQQSQPSLIEYQNIKDPVRISRVIYYFNLIESFTGSVVQQEYLDRTVVPLIWTFIDRVQVGFHAHLALSDVLEFCSKDTVLNLADKYFQILVDDISLDQSSVLSFEQQKQAWKNLIKSVSKHSRSRTEEITSRLIESIKSIDIHVRMTDKIKSKEETIGHDHQIDKRKKLYKLLIGQIGELNYSETVEETSKFLDQCWDLIRVQDDLIELFEVGLNQQSFKISTSTSSSQISNFGVHWWLQKIKKLNSSSLISSKL